MNMHDRKFDILDHLNLADPKAVHVDECQQCGTPWNLSSRSKDAGDHPIVLQKCKHALCLDCLQFAVNPKDLRCIVCGIPISFPIQIREASTTPDEDRIQEVKMIDLTTDSSDELSSAPSSPCDHVIEKIRKQKHIHAGVASSGKAQHRPLIELSSDSDATESDGDQTADENWNSEAFRAKIGPKARLSAKRLSTPEETTCKLVPTEEETEDAFAFLAENAPGSTLDDLRAAITLMDLRYGTHTSMARFIEIMRSA